MYLSESVQGDPIAVTGLILVPSTPAPSGGYPVVSWAHGTTGIADQCAPSLKPNDLAQLANPLLGAGYVVTATDYEGLGTPGRHPYIVGDSEARGVLDIVRAAHHLQGLDVSNRYLVWGHSQGGHAAMFSLHIAHDWAPELDLVGVVAGAPPSQLLLLNAALQKSPFRYYIAMVAAGFNAAYGNQAAPLDKVLNAEGQAFLDNVDTMCTSGLAKASAGLDFSKLQIADPATVPGVEEAPHRERPGVVHHAEPGAAAHHPGRRRRADPGLLHPDPVRADVQDRPGHPAVGLPRAQARPGHRRLLQRHAPLDQRPLRGAAGARPLPAGRPAGPPDRAVPPELTGPAAGGWARPSTPPCSSAS